MEEPRGIDLQPEPHGSEPPEQQDTCLSCLRRRLCRLNPILISLFALSAIIGWHINQPVLFQIHPDFAPMQHNTALAFLFCSTSLFCICLRKRKIASILALLALLLSGVTFAEFIFNTDIFGIDRMFVDPQVITRTAYPGRMSLITSISFILASLALLSSGLYRNNRNTTPVTAVVSALVAAIGLLGVMGYIGGLHNSFSWSLISQMSLPTVIGFLALALGLLSNAWRDNHSSRKTQHSWFPIAIVIGATTGALFLGNALYNQETLNLRKQNYNSASVILQTLDNELGDRHRSLRRMAKRWSTSGIPLRDRWEKDALAYLQDDPGYSHIAWVGPDLKYRWIAPPEESGQQTGQLAFAGTPDLTEISRKLRISGGVRITELNTSPPTLGITAAIHHNDESGGFIVAAIDSQRFFKTLYPKELASECLFEIKANDKQLYARGDYQTDGETSLATVRTLNHHGTDWAITTWPTAKTIDNEHTLYSRIFIALGLTVSLLLGLAFHLAHLARLKSNEASERNIRLQQEISERIRSQKQLEKASALNNAIVLHSAYAVVSTDVHGTITSFNPAAESMLGYKARELVGKQTPANFHDFSEILTRSKQLSEKYGTAIEPGFETFIHEARQGIHSQREWTYIRKDGSRLPVILAVSSLCHADGSISGYLGVANDISDLKNTMAELKKTQEKLVEASLHVGRAEVATNILHNVGNVLNSINVSSSLLSDRIRKSRISSVTKTAELLSQHTDQLPQFFETDRRGKELPAFLGKLALRLEEEQRETLANLSELDNNIQHIKEIVAMQQSYSKVVEMKEQTAIHDVIEMAMRMHETVLSKRNFKININCAPSLTANVEKHKVIQILINLISNAKHACIAAKQEYPEISINVESRKEQILIVVHDNGEGIPEENLTRIFTHGFTTKEEGHGFGLHSCAIAAKQMKGSLVASSEGIGRGATFTLTLPV